MRTTVFLLVVCAARVFAQAGAGFGSLSGTVIDPSSAPVPNAKVVITNESKGIRRTLTTNQAGLFSAPALTPAGGYTVPVEMRDSRRSNRRKSNFGSARMSIFCCRCKWLGLPRRWTCRGRAN